MSILEQPLLLKLEYWIEIDSDKYVYFLIHFAWFLKGFS